MWSSVLSVGHLINLRQNDDSIVAASRKILTVIRSTEADRTLPIGVSFQPHFIGNHRFLFDFRYALTNIQLHTYHSQPVQRLRSYHFPIPIIQSGKTLSKQIQLQVPDFVYLFVKKRIGSIWR